MKKLLKNIFYKIFPEYRDLQVQLSEIENAFATLSLRPVYESSANLSFNSQNYRREIVKSLLDEFKFDAIIETGTYWGDTTGWFLENSKLPVYSCEISPAYVFTAQKRLSKFKNVHLELGDSRNFLSNLSKTDLKDNTCFFYLDAHWLRDLPLTQEIKIIDDAWLNYVIMIDDFRVPGDDGYGYDDYGPGKRLDIRLIKPILDERSISAFFPSSPSERETGAKRGCVVLTKTGRNSDQIKKVAELLVKVE